MPPISATEQRSTIHNRRRYASAPTRRVANASLVTVKATKHTREAFEIISPPTAKTKKCMKEIQLTLRVLKATKLIEMYEKPPTQRQLLALIKSLHRFLNCLNSASPLFLARMYCGRCNTLDGVRDSSQLLEDMKSILKRLRQESAERGKGPRQLLKYACALYAWDLLAKLSDKYPTLTDDGPLCRLASCLYKISSGIPACDLQWQCRDVVARHKQAGMVKKAAECTD